MNTLIDPFGRRISYLRLSVTDRCNLRCLYCLPAQGLIPSLLGGILTDDEIARVVSIAVRLGINKIRITGGEPLVRPGIVGLINRLAQLPGIEEVSLSTNGMLLPRLAQDLFRAGLRRVNVSLDTLRPDRFQAITRLGRLESVLEAIHRSLEIGFSPVKVNMVVMKDINSDEIPDFVALTHRLPLHVRFIELMPIGETGFFGPKRWFPMPEIQRLCGELVPLGADEGPKGFGPAAYFQSPGALGTVGFIGALSCNFCRRCNRLRLTAKGRLLPCLASEAGTDLKGLLRAHAEDAEIAAAIRQVVAMKPERHKMEPDAGGVREAFMCALGG